MQPAEKRGSSAPSLDVKFGGEAAKIASGAADPP
jgi:hypothetical protein